MQRKLYKKEERGLKGGPNYQVSEMMGSVTSTGYWPDSPDRNNDFNIIPSNNITMEGMDMDLIGQDDEGNTQYMTPGNNYTFPGNYVTETPVAKQGGVFLGHYTFKDGGLVRMDPGGPINPNFKWYYDPNKSTAENLELNRRAELAGHNSVAEYEKSGWAWQPEKTHFTQGQGTGQGVLRAKPQTRNWEQQIMEGIPAPAAHPKAKSKTTTSSSSLKADLKKMNQDLLSGSAPSESTFAEPRIPIHWVNNTAEGIKAIEAEWERVRQEGIAEERAKIQADNAEINKRKQQFAKIITNLS